MLDRMKELFTADELEAYDQVLLPTTRERMELFAAEGEKIKVRKRSEEKWVIDGTSQVGTNPLGHRNPELVTAMQNFLDSNMPTMAAGNDAYHPLQQQLAEELTAIFPGNQTPGDIKTYFCNSGSEAVERGCLKAAQLYKGGNTYMACENAFHGRTSLALSCNFSKSAHTEGYNSLFRSFPVPFAQPSDDIDTVLGTVEQRIVQEGADNINALIVEPIQGEGGYNVPHKSFLSGLRAITREHDIPLVMDEVQASIRTGEWFACENWGVEPDMISIAKAFSGGMTPFGAAMIKDEYATEQEGKHSSTFGGNPKECFMALKTIELIQKNNFLQHAAREGDYLAKEWDELVDHEAIVDVRGKGLMQGIEFADAETRDAVLEELFDTYDILTMACGNDAYNPTIRFLLPVNVDHDTVEHIADSLIQAIHAVAPQ